MATSNKNSPLFGKAAEALISTFAADVTDKVYGVVFSQAPNVEISGEAGSQLESDTSADSGFALAILPEWMGTILVKRNKWTSGKIYTPWDHTKDMFEKPFYVDHKITSGRYAGAWAIQVCINSPGNGSLGVASVKPPDQINYGGFDTEDGYRWKTIDLVVGKDIQFVDQKHIPIKEMLSVDDNYKKYASTDPVLIKKDIEERELTNWGEILAVRVTNNDVLSKLRWPLDRKPILRFISSPEDGGREAIIETQATYITDPNNSEVEGWKITGFKVTDGGARYHPTSAYSLYFNYEPNQNEFSGEWTSDYIFGSSRFSDQSDRIIKLVISPYKRGMSNVRDLLGANILGVNALITADDLKRTIGTDISNIGAATLVSTPYVGGKEISKSDRFEAARGGTARLYDMSTKVTVSSATALDDGKSVKSTPASGSALRGAGQVSSSSTVGSSTTYRLVNSDKNWKIGQELYDSTEFTPAKHAIGPGSAVDGKAAFESATTYTVSDVVNSEVGIGQKTQNLGTISLGTQTLNAAQGILLKFRLTDETLTRS